MSEKSSRFTGRQLTVIVASVAAAAVLMPTAVYAAATIVQLADPYSGSKARVFSGKVAVGDGVGALTVDGTVTAAIKQPTGNFSVYDFATEAGNAVLYDIPANAGVAISSLTAAHESGTGSAMVRVRTFTPTSPGACTGGGSVVDEITAITVPAGDTSTASYSPPILVPKSGAEKCLVAFVYLPSGTQTVAVTATGFRY